ncbi:putative CFEM domain-containing protein [Botrytis cinerea]
MVKQLNTACLVIIVVFEVVGSIFCFGRLASRLVSKPQWKGLMMWSDICMSIAWVLSVVETVAIYGQMDLAAQIKANATDPGIGPYGPVSSGFKDGKYITGDLLVLCIPIYVVKDLKMNSQKKAAAIFILCMGLGVTAIGICRLVFTYRAFYPNVPDPGLNVDSTISQIETGLALVIGCVPDLLPLIRLLVPGFFNFATRQSTHPARYPYSSTLDSKRKPQGQSDILNNTTYQEHGLDVLKLRPNNGLVQRETHVRGAASTDSLTGSQIEMFDKNIDDKSDSKTIIKTTHFSVKESDLNDPSKTWSNV